MPTRSRGGDQSTPARNDDQPARQGGDEQPTRQHGDEHPPPSAESSRRPSPSASRPPAARMPRDGKGRSGDPEDAPVVPQPGRLLAEVLGTFALTTVAAGGDVAARMTAGQVTDMARAVAPGLLVMAFVYALGDVSGAHFNPAVTLGFALKRLFPVRWLVTYWVAQLAGALLAAAGLHVLFGGAADAGVSVSHVATGPALAIETFLSFLLLTVVLGTADRHRLVGPNAAIAVGATIALCGLIALPLTGASMNPARSSGPAVAVGRIGDLWIYWLGPMLGALLAVGFTAAVHGETPRDHEQVEAAVGREPGREGEGE